MALAGAAPVLIAGNAHSADKVLKVVLVSDLKGIDPVFNTATYAAYHGYLVYDQLFALDSKGKPQPQMVDKWEVSPDRKAWTFHLRPGQKFHDGSPVRAADAVASILRWKDRDVVGKAMFSAGAKLDVVDDRSFGLALGIAVGWHRALYSGIYPVLVGFNSIPKVAVVPVLILWFGIGEVPALLTAFLISFFPIVVNVATGLATMEPELEDVLRALGASKMDIMLKVGIPRTQPYLFGSLKVAITLAFVGTVVSETVGANGGLGYQIALAGSNFQMPLVFAALLLLAVEGIAMYAVFAYVEVYFTRWAFRSSMSAAA